MMDSRFPQLAQQALGTIGKRLHKLECVSRYGVSTREEVKSRLRDIEDEMSDLDTERHELEILLSNMDEIVRADLGMEVRDLTQERRRIETYLKSIGGGSVEVTA